ncbi:hypothetical protein Efla_000199 [Eimeria flavescens]
MAPPAAKVGARGGPATKRMVHVVTDGFSFLEIDKELSPQEEKLRQHVRCICEAQVAPIAAKLWDTASFDNRLVQACKDMGPAGLQIKGYGCAGMTNVEATLTVLEMARVDASLATFAVVHSGLAMQSIAVAGTDGQKQYWLPKARHSMSQLNYFPLPFTFFMACWEKIGCFGLTEAEHGSDAGGLETTATRTTGGYVLNGNKRWIGNATICDVAVIWARDVETGKIEGFLVERSFPGFTPSVIRGKASLRSVENADILLTDCFVPDSHKFKPGGFSGNTKLVLESSRALVAAACTGLLFGAYDSALRYCSTRVQFGRPLTGFQLVQERLMRALGLAHACSALTLQLARRMDTGRTSMPLVALVKATASRMAREGAKLCREVVGGNGIVLENGVAKALADVEALYTYEGTYDINMLIVGRAATGRNALT